MFSGLYKYYLSPDTFIDQNFIINSGENSRGVRFILSDFKTLDLRFKNIIEIDKDLYENDNILYNKDEGYLDVLFPLLRDGTYRSELVIISDGKILLSGVFSIIYKKSLTGGYSEELKKLDGINLLMGLEHMKKDIKDLIDKTKSLNEIVDKNFVYEQIYPQKEWNIVHNLNKYPTIATIDSAGSEVIGSIKYMNKNEVTISFSHAFSGKAFFN